MNDLIEAKNNAVVTINNITVATGGTCLRLKNSAQVTLSEVTVRNCTRDNEGAGVKADAATTLTISDSLFTDNTVTNDKEGGHIYTEGTLNVSNTDFINGHAGKAGAIWADGATVDLDDCDFTDNDVDEDGGHIYLTGGATLDMDGGSIVGDGTTINALDDAGGIYFNGGTHTIDNVSFTDLIAVDKAGALRLTGDGTLTMSNNTLNGNMSSNGGHLYLESTFTDSGSTFTGGRSLGDGGAVYVASSPPTMSFTSSSFTDNESLTDDGGAIYFGTSGTLSVVGVVFNDNDAADNGGHIYLTGSATNSATINSSSSFTLGDAEDGGAVYGGDNTTLTIENTSFTTNTASANGGAIRIDGGSLTMSANSFSGNSANAGGQIHAETNITDAGSTFASGTATNDGGAIRVTAGPADLSFTNSTFSGNESETDDGGAIYYGTGGTLTVVGGTFSDNNAADNGGHIYFTGAATNSANISGNTSFSLGA
ncbi:MAG: hypothetical protein HN348_32845, partial [Proteobacteria bacterium]|nr:hypothetical protein [Pseudomonadota bacterium]